MTDTPGFLAYTALVPLCTVIGLVLWSMLPRAK